MRKIRSSLRAFFDGMAHILDFSDSLSDYRLEKVLPASDFEAIESDWEAVGNDLRRAMEQFAREQKQKREAKSSGCEESFADCICQ